MHAKERGSGVMRRSACPIDDWILVIVIYVWLSIQKFCKQAGFIDTSLDLLIVEDGSDVDCNGSAL